MTAPLRPSSATRRRTAPDREPVLRVLPRAVRPRRDRRLLAVVGGGLLFAAVLAGNVAVQAQTTQGQFELERLQKTARERQADYQQLRLEVAELEAPQRIVGRARQLGMVEPSEVTYLTPTADTSAGASGARSETGPAPTAEAAQGWSDVKRHLDSR